MHSCPECGFDVLEEGLCPSCEQAFLLSRKKKSRFFPVMWKTLLIVLIMAFAFFLGRFSVMGKTAELFVFSWPGIVPKEYETGEERGIAGRPGAVRVAEPLSTNPVEIPSGGTAGGAAVPLSFIDIPLKGAEGNSPAFLLEARKEHPPLKSKKDFIRWMTENTPQQERFLGWKWALGQSLLESGDIVSGEVFEAFLRTPREEFCRPQNIQRAYDDIFMSIGYGVTISDPNVVSRMTETIRPAYNQKVLEIGTGSGYQSAILAQLSNYVYTIEIIKPLAEETDALYKKLEADYPEYRNVKRKIDDGYYGWKEYAPFDRIIVTCGIDHIPPPLIEQLAPDGIMVIPVGPRGRQTLLKVVKKLLPNGGTVVEREDVYKGKMKVRFVPFTDKGGGIHSAKD